MASHTTVVARNLSLQFLIASDKTNSLKEAVSRFRIRRGRRNVTALNSVSFEVEKGQAVGLIGENGSGKSTLLRCLAGIIPPTSGEVLVAGTVSSLIELGAGFHPELTGRENALITGVLFGLTRQKLEQNFEDIVSFAELEEVIDQPVRSYSSGMYVRLAFSLAVHVEPDVLLIDEVLAVGDEAFQRRCIEKVADLIRAGVTVMFVSHDLKLVEKVCHRSLWLHHGALMSDGPTDEVIEKYLAVIDQAGH